ncbi:unnamed protein product [Phaedon cochleariae]|uniref:EF-hand domain-containing protein n=1 Tax=Phaedon cochleariae TaxID=80249 RepID=A0A9P0GVX0_PHACE|nr:unnamed protein product [Phaedon cochleariae]
MATKAKNAPNKAFGMSLDMLMDSMEETRFKKKHQNLVERLSRKYHFSYIEIECLLIVYYKLQKDNVVPQPGVSKSQLRDVFHFAFDMTDDALMDRIFWSLIKGTSSFVSMETWITILSLFLRGSLDEKINYCFSVYDFMGEGILGREAIFHLLKNSLVGVGGDEDTEESVKDMIEIITKKMDFDRDGKISFSDYKQAVLKTPGLLECFGQCLPNRYTVNAFLTSMTHYVKKEV